MTKLKKKILSMVGLISILGIMSITGLAMGCVSATGLSIEISSPQDGATVSESSVTVTCTTSGYTRGEAVVGEQTVRIVPEVTVNGIKAKAAENGSFSAQVELTEGENTIEAVALLDNVEVRDSITVTYSLGTPAMSVEITSPEDGAELNESPVAVTGTVSDNASAVTVNGVAAEVAADGSFAAQIELTEGENVITAVATLGELQTEDSITVTYTPL